VKLVFRDEARKKLNRIGAKDVPKVKKKIGSLLLHPLVGKPLSGEFAGTYSLKAWPLRILYSFDSKTQTIIIETIDYRGDVYK